MAHANIKSYWDGGDLIFTKRYSAVNPQIEFGVNDNGLDCVWYGATASAYMLWDESADNLLFAGGAGFSLAGGGNLAIDAGDITLGDSDAVLMGDGSDARLEWNGDYLAAGPATGFWADAPSLAYPDPAVAYQWFEDFIGHVTLPTSTGGAGGWYATGDATYDVKSAAGSLGGQIQLAPETASDNEVYFQLGGLGTETFIEYTKNSNLKSWVEFRVAYTSITNAANMFVGLAEEGAAVADFINDAGTDFANKDVVGFTIWEADPDAIDCNHKITGGALVDAGLAGVPTAGAFVTLGLYFDGVETVTWYFNGTAVQTADLDTATFPTGEEMSPIIALKNGAADAALQIDWIKMVVER
jgi:hypothetical protein